MKHLIEIDETELELVQNALVALSRSLSYPDKRARQRIESLENRLSDLAPLPIAVVIENNLVNHPPHYRPGKYEAIKVIEAWDLNFNLGNAVKYISRIGLKGDPKQDIGKTIWYLNRELNK